MAARLSPRWVAALAALTSCSYVSSYVPPEDGRARPLWVGNQIVTYGTELQVLCADELSERPEAPEQEPPAPLPIDSGGGPAMTLDANGLWVAADLLELAAYHHVLHHPHHLAAGHHFSPGLGSGGLGQVADFGGGWDSDAAAYVFATLLVVGIVASSGVAVTLATLPPASRSVPGAIDEVNAANDRLRADIVDCRARMATAQEQQP